MQQGGDNPKKEESKPQRLMKSFEADWDVDNMLKRAERKRLRLVWICNTAVRQYLTEKGYARKKDLLAEEKRLAKIKALEAAK